MKMNEFADLPVIDCHVHFRPDSSAGGLGRGEAFLSEIAEKGRLGGYYLTDNSSICLKFMKPGFYWAGASPPRPSAAAIERGADAARPWRGFLPLIVESGFDGIGEMGTKPKPRSRHVALDGPINEDLWQWCESRKFPVLCHVADPEEFWDEKLAPQWAKDRDWVYYKGDYPSKAELCAEAERVLGRHPGLPIVFAHMYFITADIEAAARFLDQHPCASYDLTLGIELMHNISRKRDAWRKFFITYQDRILFGTDIAYPGEIAPSVARIWLLRNFLESREEFFTPPEADSLLTRYREPFVGLDLPRPVLEKIYAGNFKRLWGATPAPAKLAGAKAVAEYSDNAVILTAIEGPAKCAAR